MDPPGGPRRHRFGFVGRKRRDIPTADSGDGDAPDERERSARGDRRVAFAGGGDPAIFRNVKKRRSPRKDRTGQGLRCVDSQDDPSVAESTTSSLAKRLGIMFKSSRSEDSDDGMPWSSGPTGGTNDFSHSYPGVARLGDRRTAPGSGAVATTRSMPPQLPESQGLPSQILSHGQLIRGAAERARYSVYEPGGGFAGPSRPVKRKFRVRPYHCFEEPVNMTEEEIYKNSLQPSKSYEFLTTYIKPPTKVNRGLTVSEATEKSWGTPERDGRLGSFRIELLGCISLARTKPDVYVYFVCADMAFCSDVISSYRSPMWPCASRRAAVFPINHAYAQVYIGVFDCKSRKNKENDSFCGRVVIDISALRPDTEYDVTFPLRHSTFVYDRRPRGVVRVRFALHWFNERAAVISYFKNPRSIGGSSPLIQGQPTIPCADPKTFRNVAVTCHGIDLPGKYARSAFKATTRELNLYQINIRHGARMMLLDTVLYERPLVSLYVFFAGLHCVTSNSMSLVPPYFIGFLLIQLMLNHQYYIEANGYNLGYKPLTLWEIGKALIYRADRDSPCLEPILLTKRTKERKMVDKGLKTDPLRAEEQLIEYDHREFPFSEGETYPNFSVEAALAPRTNSKTKQVSASRLHGRLSVYYSAAPVSLIDAAAEDEDDEEDDTSDYSVADDETVMGDSMAGDSLLYELDYEAHEEDEALYSQSSLTRQEVQNSLAERNSNRSRVKTGPPQDADIRGKKIPPQVHLKRVEARLHKVSRGLSVELIHPPPSYDQHEKNEDDIGNSAVKKQIMDDFDRLLGLNERSANPINRIASSFLGPLMRIIRIGIYIVRIAFNLSTWKDPYLTFWLFIALSILCFILIIFPWRTFFSLTTIALVGPQVSIIGSFLKIYGSLIPRAMSLSHNTVEKNLFVRAYFQKKAQKEKLKNDTEKTDSLEKEMETVDASPNDTQGKANGGDTLGTSASDTKRLNMSKQNKRTGFTFWQRKYGIRGTKDEDYDVTATKSDRPIFSSTSCVVGVSCKLQPRSVAVPYSRFKKDRFYDWPPDPTVSRATPLIPWESDTQPQSDSLRSNGSNNVTILAWKREQRAEVRRRIAASSRSQARAGEN